MRNKEKEHVLSLGVGSFGDSSRARGKQYQVLFLERITNVWCTRLKFLAGKAYIRKVSRYVNISSKERHAFLRA